MGLKPSRFLGPVLLSLVASSAWTQVPVGAEFQVSSYFVAYTPWHLRPPAPGSIAMAADGRFVVTWITRPSPDYDFDVAARRFTAAGRPAGPEFLVTPSDLRDSLSLYESVAMEPDGDFLVLWQTGFSGHLMSRRFDAQGLPLGRGQQIDRTTTSGAELEARVATAPNGNVVVVWSADALGTRVIRGRRFDPSGARIGSEFQVSAVDPDSAFGPSVAYDDRGYFVVVWTSAASHPDLDGEVRGRRFAADGSPLGAEFVISSARRHWTRRPRVACAPGGAFVVAWSSKVGPSTGPGQALARGYDAGGAPTGGEFTVVPAQYISQMNVDIAADGNGGFVIVFEDQFRRILARRFDSAGAAGPVLDVASPYNPTPSSGTLPAVASDRAGNFVVAWHRGISRISARRYAAGLMASALSVDPVAGPSSDGNGVFEAGETVTVAPSWLNANTSAQAFSGVASAFAGPGAPGDPSYAITDATATYGTVASGATASCDTTGDCYALGLGVPGSRPATHWDASFQEGIAPANLAAERPWTLHVGESFTDVPRASGSYRFVETLLHHGVTSGCTPTTYCPAVSATRQQMAVFVLAAKEGLGYRPPACREAPMFADVPVTSPFCGWVEELARRGVVGGCGGGNYCPTSSVLRGQMAVFVLRTVERAFTPPACGATPMFADVPSSSPFCPWVEELARRGFVAGCGGGNYCPGSGVTREQMAVFISLTLGLSLYGP
jgi:S-layer family protein